MKVIHILLIVLSLSLIKADLFVKLDSTCGSTCDGTSSKPFTNIQSAINSISLTQRKSTIIQLNAGTYTGVLNTGINIDRPIKIKSIGVVIIDCKKTGNAFFVKDTEFLLSDVTIQDCSSSLGGALTIENSMTTITKTTFTGNIASFGGAIYSISSNNVIYSSIFDKNVALELGSAIYSISSKFQILSTTKFTGATNAKPTYIGCKNSNIKLDDQVDITQYITCDKGCLAKYKSKSYCDSASDTCSFTGVIPSIVDDTTIFTTGMLYEAFYDVLNPSGLLFKKIVPDNTIEDFLNGHEGKVYGVLTGYLHMDNSMKVKFRFEGKNLGFSLEVNGVKYLDVAQTNNFDFPFEIYLVSKVSHQIQITLSSDTTGVGRSFKLYQISHDYRIFYTKKICGDGVQDDLDYCIEDSYSIYDPTKPGEDRVCGDKDYHLNFQDCFNEISQNCEIPKKKDHISPLGNVGGMIGDLVENQYLWNVPGSEHFTYGMSILSGQPSKAPVFQFDYCVEVANNILEDPYRMMAYEIPPSLNIKSLPICTYSTSTKMYNSFSEYQTEFQLEAGLKTSGDIKLELIDFKGAFSLEGSIETARDQSQSSTKNIFVTELNCTTTYIEMDDQRIRFHPMFLKDLATIKQESDLLKIFDKYGTYYYSSAYMGGKLVQISTTSESIDTDEKKSKWSIAAELTFGASANVPGFNGEGSSSINFGMSSEEESMSEVESKSTYSSIITYGGPPASFAPSDSFQATTYRGWSSSIDLLPVPIGYNVKPISDLLKDTKWTIKLGSKTSEVFELWENMEKIYYQMNRINPIQQPQDFKYSLIFDFISVTNLPQSLPGDIELQVKWTNKAVTEIFKTPIKFVYYDPDGTETEYLFPYSYQTASPIDPRCVNNPSVSLSGTATESKTCDPTNKVTPTLFRVDFYGPNFMESAKKPDIYIFGINYIGESTLISWYTGEAIKLKRTTGVESVLSTFSPNTGRGIYQFESARTTLTSTTSDKGSFETYIGTAGNSRDSFYNYIYTVSKANSKDFNFYNRFRIDITLSSQKDKPVTRFYTFHREWTGASQFRVDYLLYTVNNKTTTEWKSKVYYYHILENPELQSYSDLVAVDNYFPLKPLNKDVPSKWFSFDNYNHPRDGGSGTIVDPFNFNSPNPSVEFYEFSS
ncbi:hypothetical protein PPL_07802 [Heterostelium album PN500]|uniref:MACPF domain-containing protein n=1 Tax=Heterostelium pallidum (strain ATCC 26659 / Pp 5 / PN500) TaxID=670386 RepID=D3BH00_HETP5|nr:hypothetical protein PPL_07802 [Heterostelium album PN500]EFA79384.1 hypothetical protein PPL_07802 [Heterostelium album PN500]|eukprot:XP_020431505.1 hypothetical protein PPL_07802 [Heterostelium album PN500]